MEHAQEVFGYVVVPSEKKMSNYVLSEVLTNSLIITLWLIFSTIHEVGRESKEYLLIRSTVEPRYNEPWIQ